MADKKTADEQAAQVSYSDSMGKLEKMRASLTKTNSKLMYHVASDNAGGIEDKEADEKELAAFTQSNTEYMAELDKVYAALSQQLEWVRSAREQAIAAQRNVRELSSRGKITDDRNL